MENLELPENDANQFARNVAQCSYPDVQLDGSAGQSLIEMYKEVLVKKRFEALKEEVVKAAKMA